MRELMKSNNPVLLSYIDALLNEADIVHEIADIHLGTLDGYIGALAQRVMVDEEDYEAAKEIVRTAIENPPQPAADAE
jgi:Putative prokaryotic signal transducing protein